LEYVILVVQKQHNMVGKKSLVKLNFRGLIIAFGAI
jgi:hypothetical protein